MEDITYHLGGRGKHRKRKKGGRKISTRRKSDEHNQQQACKENANPSISDKCNDQHSALTKDTSMIPIQWQKPGDVKYCKVEKGANGLGQVTMSLVRKPDRSVSAFLARKEVSSSTNALTCLHCSNDHIFNWYNKVH